MDLLSTRVGRALVMCAALSVGCGESWKGLTAKHRPAYDALRLKLRAVKAEIDRNHDPAAYPACAASPLYRFTRRGPHTLDFIDYDRLGSGGLKTDQQGVMVISGVTPLSQALFWTHPVIRYSDATRAAVGQLDGFPGPRPTERDVDVLTGTAGITAVAVVRERSGATIDHVEADLFLATLDPPRVVCAFPLGNNNAIVTGHSETRAYRELTINRQTGKVVSERRVLRTTGDERRHDPRFELERTFIDLVAERLGINYEHPEVPLPPRPAPPTQPASAAVPVADAGPPQSAFPIEPGITASSPSEALCVSGTHAFNGLRLPNNTLSVMGTCEITLTDCSLASDVGSSPLSLSDRATVTLNGGEIRSRYSAVSTMNRAHLTLNGARIRGGSIAIFAMDRSRVDVTGSTIEGPARAQRRARIEDGGNNTGLTIETVR